jgi:hypothetical protein
MMLLGLALIISALEPAGSVQPIAAPKAALAPVLLPAGTAVRLVTVGPINSRSVLQGQRFALQVADDVTVGSRVVIPRGTPAVGEVEQVSGTGMFGKAARLSLTALFIEVDGERVNLAGGTEANGHDATAGAAVAVALAGTFGLIITGKSASVPAGSLLFSRVRNDVALRFGGAAAQR